MHSVKGVNFSSGSTRCGVPAITIYKCVCPKVNKVFKKATCALLYISWDHGMDASSCVTISPTMCTRSTSIRYQSVTSSVPCRRRWVSQDVLENLGHVVDGHEQDPLSSLSTLSHSFTGRRSYDRTIVSTTCRTRPRATATTGLCIKSWLMQPLISS